ncbi:MAG: aminotransferase class I/II-fold pyridoxal phosphate-dependent enzyme [Prevotellaceae bacterium]|nr:aminotransferase class I/II-fold pyridoxal phosphate-dependent enzyme [Prevotellaceae bacterium]
MDIFKRIQENQGALGQLSREIHGYFTFPKLEGEIGPRMKFRGREVINWSLNDYLGLAAHPEVRKADEEAAAKWGFAYPMGARIVSGQTTLHEDLENRLAEFVGKEAAYVLNFGYQGMVSIIDALCHRNDVIVFDANVHVRIMDGIRLHIGKRFVYQHNDMDSLLKQLKRAAALAKKQNGGVLVITESIFGISGELAQLDKIVALKNKYKFRLLVDETQAFGVMGATGIGVSEHFDVLENVDIFYSTFTKSLALIGGFVAGKEYVINYLRYNMRSQLYAKSLPTAFVESIIKRLELIQKHPEYRKNVWNIANTLQNGVRQKGLNIGKTASIITPIYLSANVQESANLVMEMRENYNLFCPVVVYPVIPEGQIVLHLISTAAHTPEDVEYTVNAIADINTNLELGRYNKETVVHT